MLNQKLLNALPSVYVVISCAEATSNMSNLTGFIFGPRGEGKNYREILSYFYKDVEIGNIKDVVNIGDS